MATKKPAKKRAATLEPAAGNQVIPGITGTDFVEPVSAGRVLVLKLEPNAKARIDFVNDGINETSVMIHRKVDPILGTWQNVERKGNGGGKNYTSVNLEPDASQQVFVISGWHKNQGQDVSTWPWYQSAFQRNRDRDQALPQGGIQFFPGFEDGGGGNDFNEPQLTIAAKYA